MQLAHKDMISLEKIPANRQLVESLFAGGVIDRKARDYALAVLYPVREWGLWIARLLLALGVTLILSGIVYFFAFNWAAIPKIVKLGSVAGAMACCAGFVMYYGLARLTGQVMSLAGSLLVGVFLAVYGQIYQTGADAYTLFLAWGLMILPWAVMTAFPALWAVWLVVANMALFLWWDQAGGHTHKMELMIMHYALLLNGAFLCVSEVLHKKIDGIAGGWLRVLVAAAVLAFGTIPAFVLIMDIDSPPEPAIAGGLIAPMVLGAFYYFYRYVRPAMHVLALTVLAVCGLVETAVGKMMFEAFERDATIPVLFMGLFTLGLFGGGVVWLRNISRNMEAEACQVTQHA